MEFEPLSSIKREYQRYRKLGEGALAQLRDDELNRAPASGLNSAAALVRHLGGNLRSRFTDFLTADGEKPWRRRDTEFESRQVSRYEVEQQWKDGWAVLESALAELEPKDMETIVTIRGERHTVPEALHRSLAHTAYHIGQLVLIARLYRGAEWQYMSIPPGHSEEFNRQRGFGH